jgi:hypothetical protein
LGEVNKKVTREQRLVCECDGTVAEFTLDGAPLGRARLPDARLNDAALRAGAVFVAADQGLVARLGSAETAWRLPALHGKAAFAVALSPDVVAFLADVAGVASSAAAALPSAAAASGGAAAAAAAGAPFGLDLERLRAARLPSRRDRRWLVELAPLTRMNAWKVAEIKAGDAVALLGFTFTGEKGDAVLRAEYLWAGGGVYGLRSGPA